MYFHGIPANRKRQPSLLSVAAGDLVEAAERESHRADWSPSGRAHFAEATEYLLAAAVSLKRAEAAVPWAGGTTA